MSNKKEIDLTAGFEPDDGRDCIRYRGANSAWVLGERVIVAGVVSWVDATGATIPLPETWLLCKDECPDAEKVAVCGAVEVFGSVNAVVDNTDLIAAIIGEGDETQTAIAALIATIDNGIDVDATLVDVDATAQAQLQALVEAALDASQPLQVEIAGDVTALANAMQAALQFAADNMQFDVIASQNGTWTVDLSAATISAVNQAFDDALSDASPLDVNITNTGGITITLDAASLAALEDTTVTIAGQPINVTLTGTSTVTIDPASVAAIAAAIAGETLDVAITGQPISITGTVDLGDISALTDWLTANDLSIDDAEIIAAINAGATAQVAETDAVEQAILDVTGTGCDGSTPALNVNNIGAETAQFEQTFLDCSGKGVTIRGYESICPATGLKTFISACVVSSALDSHSVGDTVADLTAAPWSGYFNAADYPNGTPTVVDDMWLDGFVGITQVFDVTGNDANVDNWSLVAGSANNATVVDNGDGTFTVTATDCAGTFGYKTGDGCVATVSWDWTQRDTQSFYLGVNAEVDFTFQRIVTSEGSDVTVDWGDGATTTHASGTAINHPYDLPYTGNIVVSYSGCAAITRLDAGSNNIIDMSAVAGLTALTYLNLDDNQITDMSAVAGLAALTYLNLFSNQITDMSAVAGLAALTYLNLGGNQITDMSAVAGLTTLITLQLHRNQIIDMSAVAGLTALTYLNLGGNQITDMSAVAGLTALTNLLLFSNQIIDMSAVAGLTALTYLNLFSNQITDMSAVAGLTALITLHLGINQIIDMSAVAGLTALTYLNLGGNQITDMSAVAGLTALTTLLLYNNSPSVADVNIAICSVAVFMNSGTFQMQGTNPAPDNSSGGVDGLACKAALITAGVSVLTN